MEKLIVKNLTPIGNLTSTLSTSTGLVQIPGPKGEPGDSAYDVAVANGFKGSEQEWLASIKGEQGESGVYIGSEEPPKDANVWIDPNGDTSEALATQGYVDDAINNIEFPTIDLTDYATQSYVDEAIANINIPESLNTRVFTFEHETFNTLTDEEKFMAEMYYTAIKDTGVPPENLVFYFKVGDIYYHSTRVYLSTHPNFGELLYINCPTDTGTNYQFVMGFDENKKCNSFTRYTQTYIHEPPRWRFTSDLSLMDLYNAKEIYIRIYEFNNDYMLSSYVVFQDYLGAYSTSNKYVFTTPDGADGETPYWQYDGNSITVVANSSNYDFSLSELAFKDSD